MHRLVALSCVALFACDDSSPKDATVAATTPAPAPELRPLVTPDEAKALLDAWQGAWVMPFRTVSSMDAPPSPIGTQEVWAIEGDTLVRWDGLAEETMTIEVLAPCLLLTKQGDRHSAREFAFTRSGLYVGALALGIHSDDRSVMCADRTAWTIDDGRCRKWERPLVARGNALRPEDAQCSIATAADGKQTFEVPAGEGYSAKSVRIVGDLVRPDLAPPQPAKRFATMAEAQASLR
jgi:hypothetical protein